jgi:hypothetical protein
MVKPEKRMALEVCWPDITARSIFGSKLEEERDMVFVGSCVESWDLGAENPNFQSQLLTRLRHM